ncbi:MAG: hypothetical protein ACXWUP_00710 [Allosphingosinicella sp.]
MDMAFLRRAERMLDEQRPARLDHSLLMAALAAQQSPLRRSAGTAAANRPHPAGEEDPLVELLLAGPGWRRAATQQRGCFSRAEAGRRINGL